MEATQAAAAAGSNQVGVPSVRTVSFQDTIQAQSDPEDWSTGSCDAVGTEEDAFPVEVSAPAADDDYEFLDA
eukprot:3446193-Amphidinium_carterae.1